MRIYISGAITGMDRERARRRFADAAQAIAIRGHEPVNPFDIPNGDCECPLTLPDGVAEHSWACCLRKDVRVLVDCDAIYMLTAVPERGWPGWETSHGARLELQVASAVGLGVYLSLFDLDFQGEPAKC